jgi:hypothetical protein
VTQLMVLCCCDSRASPEAAPLLLSRSTESTDDAMVLLLSHCAVVLNTAGQDVSHMVVRHQQLSSLTAWSEH